VLHQLRENVILGVKKFSSTHNNEIATDEEQTFLHTKQKILWSGIGLGF
jgi:hypothetical protein